MKKLILIALTLAVGQAAQAKGDMRRGLDKGDMRPAPTKGDMRRVRGPSNPIVVILRWLTFSK